MPNYATKADLKNAMGVDTSNFARKVDLANLNLDISKLKLESTIFYQIFIFSPNDSSSKTMKNVFLFHLKSSFHSRDI